MPPVENPPEGNPPEGNPPEGFQPDHKVKRNKFLILKNKEKGIQNFGKEAIERKNAEKRAKIERLESETNMEKEKEEKARETKKKVLLWMKDNPDELERMKKEAVRFVNEMNPEMSAFAKRPMIDAKLRNMVGKVLSNNE